MDVNKKVYCPVTADYHLATMGESHPEVTSTQRREKLREEWETETEPATIAHLVYHDSQVRRGSRWVKIRMLAGLRSFWRL